MPVAEPFGAEWPEWRAALEEAWIHAAPDDFVWKATIAQGQPTVRVFIKGRWWELRLKKGAWHGGKKAAYEMVASGVAAGELIFCRPPAAAKHRGNRVEGESGEKIDILCRMVAWLPRARMVLKQSRPARCRRR
jgi:hypothetical protein